MRHLEVGSAAARYPLLQWVLLVVCGASLAQETPLLPTSPTWLDSADVPSLQRAFQQALEQEAGDPPDFRGLAEALLERANVDGAERDPEAEEFLSATLSQLPREALIPVAETLGSQGHNWSSFTRLVSLIQLEASRDGPSRPLLFIALQLTSRMRNDPRWRQRIIVDWPFLGKGGQKTATDLLLSAQGSVTFGLLEFLIESRASGALRVLQGLEETSLAAEENLSYLGTVIGDPGQDSDIRSAAVKALTLTGTRCLSTLLDAYTLVAAQAEENSAVEPLRLLTYRELVRVSGEDHGPSPEAWKMLRGRTVARPRVTDPARAEAPLQQAFVLLVPAGLGLICAFVALWTLWRKQTLLWWLVLFPLAALLTISSLMQAIDLPSVGSGVSPTWVMATVIGNLIAIPLLSFSVFLVARHKPWQRRAEEAAALRNRRHSQAETKKLIKRLTYMKVLVTRSGRVQRVELAEKGVRSVDVQADKGFQNVYALSNLSCRLPTTRTDSMRRTQRIQMMKRVWLMVEKSQTHPRETMGSGTASNVSKNGICIETSLKLEPKDRLRIVIEELKGVVFKAHVEVVWTRKHPQKDKDTWFVGTKIVDIDETSPPGEHAAPSGNGEPGKEAAGGGGSVLEQAEDRELERENG